jgi:hypothetical protein
LRLLLTSSLRVMLKRKLRLLPSACLSSALLPRDLALMRALRPRALLLMARLPR